jgi:hypothetical protein
MYTCTEVKVWVLLNASALFYLGGCAITNTMQLYD